MKLIDGDKEIEIEKMQVVEIHKDDVLFLTLSPSMRDVDNINFEELERYLVVKVVTVPRDITISVGRRTLAGGLYVG